MIVMHAGKTILKLLRPAQLVGLTAAIAYCVVFSSARQTAEAQPPEAKTQSPPDASPSPPSESTEPARIIDVEPFDRLTLDEANGSEVLEIVPVELPGRRLPDPRRPGDKIAVRLFSKLGETFEVEWRHIEKLELYEEMVLTEALRLTTENRFDEAFECFEILNTEYPHTLGLSKGTQTFLLRHAGMSYQTGKHLEAISLLNDAHKIDPDRSGLATALANVTSKLLESYQRAGSYESVRQLLSQAIAKYPDNPTSSLLQWRDRLISDARDEREQAEERLAGGQPREAQLAARRMTRIWPDLPDTAELQARIAKQYPMVFVGVTRPGTLNPNRTIDRPDSWRVARLVENPLVRIGDYDLNGAQYISPWGDITTDDNGRSITFELTNPGTGSDKQLTGFALANRLISVSADGSTQDDWWKALIGGVEIQAVYQTRVELRSPYVRPEALFRHVGFYDGATANQAGPFAIADPSDTQVSYVLRQVNPPPALGQIREVVEQTITSPAQGLTALRQGKIDVLARLFPADVEPLSEESGVIVGRYRLPTLHCLVPNYDRRRMQSRVLRRGLLHGIDREEILRSVLLRNTNLPGCQVISGPLPIGFSREDPLGYGYDRAIAARDYEPTLALTLFRVARAAAEGQFQAENSQMPPLVLAHPDAYLPRTACEEIAFRLGRIGIACETRQLPPGVFEVPDEDYDLLYVEVTMAEPVVDVIGLLGEGGLGDADNPYIRLAINQLIHATNWRDARAKLAALHQICHNHLPVLPLWQMSDHYAHHPRVSGIGVEPISLYHNIGKWRVGPK